MNEKELNQRIRTDLSEWFDITPGETSGTHRYEKKRIRPDILCSPSDRATLTGIEFDFCIECKIIKNKRRRHTLYNGFWQAYQQLHDTTYPNHSPRFALVATEQSYTGFSDQDMRVALQHGLMTFSQMNIGWLDMQKGYPRFWMTEITPPSARPFWSPYRPAELCQIAPIRIGSNRSTQKHSNTFKK